MTENNGKEKKVYTDHGPVTGAGEHDITSRIKLDADNRALVVWPVYVNEDGSPDFEMLAERYGVKTPLEWVQMAISSGISTRCVYKGTTVEEYQECADKFKVGQRQSTGGQSAVMKEISAAAKAKGKTPAQLIAEMKAAGII